MTKICTKCGIEKSLDEFHNSEHGRLGKQSYCMVCMRSEVNANNAKPESKLRIRLHGVQPKTKAGRANGAKRKRASHRNDPTYVAQQLYKVIKYRARSKGLPFDLVSTDIVIPEFCPALGIRLHRVKGRKCDSSPSVDRLVPRLGYVKGNIRVVSSLANDIKSSATAEDILKVGNWLLNIERELES